MQRKALSWALASVAGVLALQPGTANAQAWIGLMVGDMIAQGQAAAQEQACMSGTPMPDSEIAEARQPAVATMQTYFAAAKAGSPISTQFHLDKRARWTSGGASVTMAQLDRQNDPFARGGLALDAEPLGFFRAGDGASALGQWQARDASGKVAGTYTGLFTRRAGAWKLSTLELTPATAYADPVVQYCHKAGDVLPYRLATTKWSRELFAGRVTRTEAKVQKAAQVVAGARAKADKSPNNASAQAAAQKAEARARDLATQLEARRTELATAQTAEAAALADKKAAEDARAAGVAALGTAK